MNLMPPSHPPEHRRRDGFERALLLVLLVASTAACAVDVPRVSLLPEGDPPLPASSGLVLEVLPFADERPEEQRVGTSTSLWPLLLYYRRVGDWTTSDETFEQDVAEAVTQAAAAALSGGRFGDLRSRAEPLAGVDAASCLASGADYLAAGRIRDLYGVMHQRFELLLIPTPFIGFFLWRNDKSDALGVAHIDVRVFDCGRARWVYQRQLRSQQREAEESISLAAQRALQDAMEQLRNETAPGP